MENTVAQIQELLNRRAELQARLNLLPYDGTPEIKIISEKCKLKLLKKDKSHNQIYIKTYYIM